jgi:hypothetical protein
VTRRRALVGASLALLLACGDSKDVPTQARASGPTSPQSSLVRIPRDGGAARVYEPPRLEPAPWDGAGKLPAIDTLFGVNQDQALIYLRDKRGNLIALDLPARRIRSYLRGTRAAAVGADGTLYAVDTGGVVHQYTRRSPERLRARFGRVPKVLYGTQGTGVVGVDTETGTLSVLSTADSLRTISVPPGPVAVTVWGDLIAVAADTAVVVYDPAGVREPRSVRFRSGARAVAFSPSGHQLYVAQEDGELAVLDRFGLDVLRRVELPGPAAELRPGPLGRWLLARPDDGGSVWVVDLEQGRPIGTLATTWSADLPMLTSPDLVVVRDGADVVARDLTTEAMPETGRVAGGAADIWSAPGWSFLGAAPEPDDVADSEPGDTAAPGDSTVAGERVFLQVSSSRNPQWARDLAGKLAESGLPASVLDPRRQGDPYRVVLGPYASREEAEERGSTLGMPFFVITTGEPPAP